MSDSSARPRTEHLPPATRDVAVTARNVGMVYNADKERDKVVALEDIDLDVRHREFLALLGPSGCGKSTLLKIVAGLLSPKQGEVKIHPEGGDRERKLGMVFQSPVLLPWRTVLSNVLLPAEIEGNRRAAADRAHELLEMAGIEDFARSYPYQLSGGMQQRVSLVRALMNDPEILLMDEPFGALDAMTREQMNLELLRIWQQEQKTVIFVTHSIQEAVFLSDRIAMMTPRPGRISELFDVEIPRPRALDAMEDERFTALAARIRQTLLSGGERV